MSMLEYIKIILDKVSFDKSLFEKELKKGLSQLVPNEIKQLKEWCYAKYGSIYTNILNRIFRKPQFT